MLFYAVIASQLFFWSSLALSMYVMLTGKPYAPPYTTWINRLLGAGGLIAVIGLIYQLWMVL